MCDVRRLAPEVRRSAWKGDTGGGGCAHGTADAAADGGLTDGAAYTAHRPECVSVVAGARKREENTKGSWDIELALCGVNGNRAALSQRMALHSISVAEGLASAAHPSADRSLTRAPPPGKGRRALRWVALGCTVRAASTPVEAD